MSAYTVTRSTSIAAPPEAVRALVDDFRVWRTWSPWEELDPRLSRSYTGAASGVGAQYAWEGNRKAGSGAMEIIASTPQSMSVELKFFRPWKATNEVVFTFAPEGSGTHLTWTISGTNTGLAKLFARFMNFDKLVGPDMEKGLVKLKQQAETGG